MRRVRYQLTLETTERSDDKIEDRLHRMLGLQYGDRYKIIRLRPEA